MCRSDIIFVALFTFQTLAQRNDSNLFFLTDSIREQLVSCVQSCSTLPQTQGSLIAIHTSLAGDGRV